MWSAFTSLFGNQTLVKDGINGLDKIFFTEEERADYKLMFLKAYEPFKVGQRILAFMFGGTFLLVYFMAVIIYIQGIYTSDAEHAVFLVFQAKELMEWNVETLDLTVAMIVGFYFGGGMVEGAIRKKVSK